MIDIIVPSCRAYDDCWEPFATLLRKYWPGGGREWRTTLVSDKIDPEHCKPGTFTEIIAIGEDRGWVDNLKLGLDRAQKTGVVLLMQEDFFLSGPVDKAFMARAYRRILTDPSLGCLRVYPCPGPLSDVAGEFGVVHPGERYRISLQPALWRVEFLKRVLAVTRTPTEFELQGTEIAASWPDARVESVVRRDNAHPWPFEVICSAVSRSEWEPDALAHCAKHGIAVRTGRRVRVPE